MIFVLDNLLLFWFCGDFRCGVLVFIVIIYIYIYMERYNKSTMLEHAEK